MSVLYLIISSVFVLIDFYPSEMKVYIWFL